MAELELPPPEELTPLTQSLITPELAGAFNIPHEFFKQGQCPPQPQQQPQPQPQQPLQVQGSGDVQSSLQDEGFESLGGKKAKKQDPDSEDAEADSGNSGGDEPSARTLKRPRLVWTPQLHKRFVDAVDQLGIKSAVPKTIMQLMNVDGLTRENVASHLQKYRLYLKRMQGIPSEGPPSASDPLFASTPVPPGLASAAHFLQGHPDVMPVPFAMTHPYVAFDHQHPAFSISRSVPRMPGDLKEQVLETGAAAAPGILQQQQLQQPSSPSRRVLTLFPTSSH